MSNLKVKDESDNWHEIAFTEEVINKEDTSNKVTSISSGSTNTQYPSAKAVYDAVEAGCKVKDVELDNTSVVVNGVASLQSTIQTGQAQPVDDKKLWKTVSGAVDDLTGLVWVGNDTINIGALPESSYNLNFVDGGNEVCDGITTYSSNTSLCYSLRESGYLAFAYENGNWVKNWYKTITITGGRDCKDAGLIQWMLNNGTFQGVSDGLYYNDGNSWKELANKSDIKVKDVQVDGTSKVDTNGIANITGLQSSSYKANEINSSNKSSAYYYPSTKAVYDFVTTNAPSLGYLTTAPTADNTEGGVKIVILSSDPATKYNGYLYFIEEE